MHTEKDLIVPTLRILAESSMGALSTGELREELKERLSLDQEDLAPLANRPDKRIDQVIRNLKSHKACAGNPIAEGLIEDVPRGFRITALGRSRIRQ